MSDLFTNHADANNASEVSVFNFNGANVRTQKINNEPWFIAKDVCDILEINNTSQALSYLDEDERCLITNDAWRINGEINVINESGLYSLILRSRKPEAKAFKKWVTSEVLPTIRRTGGYIHTTPEMSEAEIMAKAIIIGQATIKRQEAQLEIAQQQLQLQAPAVEYCEQVLASTNLHTTNSVAVHIGISHIALYKKLVGAQWIYKQGKIYYPSAKIRDKGYCDYEIVPYFNSAGEKMTREHLKWTELGRKAIIEKFSNRAC